jgi:hypothetical protein
MAENNTGRLELIATCKVQTNAELYKVIDFLNKNLKNHHVMFGLTKKEEIMTISIYEVD